MTQLGIESQLYASLALQICSSCFAKLNEVDFPSYHLTPITMGSTEATEAVEGSMLIVLEC